MSEFQQVVDALFGNGSSRRVVAAESRIGETLLERGRDLRIGNADSDEGGGIGKGRDKFATESGLGRRIGALVNGLIGAGNGDLPRESGVGERPPEAVEECRR